MFTIKSISRIFSVLFVIAFMLALVGPAHAAPAPLAQSAKAGTPSLLQFTAGGHVLGFAPGKVYLAGLDHALTVEFVGGQGNAPVGEAASTSTQTGSTAALGRVTYQGAWRGVDVSYTSAQGGLAKSSYILQPDARPADIRLKYNTPAQLVEDGTLRFAFETGFMTESAPDAFQDIDGKRAAVAVRFTLNEGLVSFDVGVYNSDHALTIDPVYVWHTFYGSSSNDFGYAITSDGSGNIYVAGTSNATWAGPGGCSTPGVSPCPLNAYAGGTDIVVVKLNSAGAYQWHTFFGSTSSDEGAAITSDGSGNIYVAGYSGATWNGPVPGSAAPLNAHAGGWCIVVVKLNSAGAYQWHTFYGSASGDFGYAITRDGSGNIYVAGRSDATWAGPGGCSTPGVSPCPLNAYASGSGTDIVVVKLNSAGAYQWDTFYGSSSDDTGYAIFSDGSGNIYVAGTSYATWNGPVPGSAAPLNAYAGGSDIVVIKLNGAGAYQWHTFYGSASDDDGWAITRDGSGNIYVAGESTATWNGPVLGSAVPLNAYAGGTDIVVVKLNSAGAYQWHTFYGGSSGDDHGYAITSDGGNIYVAGQSTATWNGPGSAAPLNAHAGGHEIVVVKLNSAGAYQWHTFYGSANSDIGNAIISDGSGNVYVTGFSTATWAGPGSAAPRNAHAGGYDIAVVKLDVSSPTITVTTTADPHEGGKCSLREAILNANNNNQSGSTDCVAGGGGAAIIRFSLSYPATIALNSELPAITDDLTIQGLGADQLIISGMSAYRILTLDTGVSLALSGVTIANGHPSSGHGGGIDSAGGNLSVTDCVFANNVVPNSGGALHNGGGSLTVTRVTFTHNQANYGGAIDSGEGNLSITDSTFTSNLATTGGGAINNYHSTSHAVTITESNFTSNTSAHGGGIRNDNAGILDITNSTFSTNTASEAGGVNNYIGTSNITNSTFFSNSATDGGSLSNSQGTLNVTNSTFSTSSTGSSANLRNFSGTTTLRNTILASSVGSNCQNGGTLNSDAHNLASDASCASATQTTLADMKLGPLANNGGSTQTFALLAGSPAIDAGNDGICAAAPVNNLDQRGVHRPQGAHCDIGAFELEPPTVFLPLILR
jgi:CSLREA domain-containing protein